MTVQFGPFTLDPRRRLLLQGDEPLALTPKAFRLLEVLIDRRPDALSKDELQQAVWPGVHVSPTSLAGLVGEVRTALGDTKREPQFIRTVHGHGYAFCGTVTDGAGGGGPEGQDTGVEYRLLHQRREISLRPGDNVVGRDREAVVWLDSPGVSRRHARIRISPDGATIEDLGSHNGTFVGGRRVQGAVPLHDGAEIKLGSTALTFRVFQAAETETEPPS